MDLTLAFKEAISTSSAERAGAGSKGAEGRFIRVDFTHEDGTTLSSKPPTC